MSLPRPLALSLIAVAIALVVVAVSGPVRRAAEERERAEAARALAERVAAERADAKARYDTERTRILETVRGHVERGEYKAAMTVASPYVPVADAELRSLYLDAAGAESRRQRADQYRSLVARECTEDSAREQLDAMLALAGGERASPPVLVRLTGPEARAVVRARTQEAPPREGAAAAPAEGWLARAREANRARILPDYLGFLLTPDAESMICVWRAQGERREGGASLRYVMDLWLAPAPDAKRLVADPVVYSETRG